VCHVPKRTANNSGTNPQTLTNSHYAFRISEYQITGLVGENLLENGHSSHCWKRVPEHRIVSVFDEDDPGTSRVRGLKFLCAMFQKEQPTTAAQTHRS
jgi:hypothetical protein